MCRSLVYRVGAAAPVNHVSLAIREACRRAQVLAPAIEVHPERSLRLELAKRVGKGEPGDWISTATEKRRDDTLVGRAEDIDERNRADLCAVTEGQVDQI